MSRLVESFSKIRIETTGIRDIAYTLLRDSIVAGRLRPGERLLEERLAEQLGISRTPLREALSRLQQEGLVLRLPSGGVRVAPVHAEEVVEIYTIRKILECQAVRWAASHITTDEVKDLEILLARIREIPMDRPVERHQSARRFHAGIALASRSPRLHSLLGPLWDEIARFRILNAMHRPDGADAEHRAILERLAARDPDGAESAMRWHLESELQLVMAHTSGPSQRPGRGAPDG